VAEHKVFSVGGDDEASHNRSSWGGEVWRGTQVTGFLAVSDVEAKARYPVCQCWRRKKWSRLSGSSTEMPVHKDGYWSDMMNADGDAVKLWRLVDNGRGCRRRRCGAQN
jgi:hypothetical protein